MDKSASFYCSSAVHIACSTVTRGLAQRQRRSLYEKKSEKSKQRRRVYQRLVLDYSHSRSRSNLLHFIMMFRPKRDSAEIDGSYRSTSSKPLPLKQRTSSVDNRKDFNVQTWWSLQDLIKAREYFVTVDNFSIWRRHLSWALEDGGDLRSYLTSRFASSMVFMSLLLGAELGVLFNSAAITTGIRLALKNQEHFTLRFWTGMMIVISIICTLFSLITTFTAWGMVSAVSNENAHCILRSSVSIVIDDQKLRCHPLTISALTHRMLSFVFLCFR
jgi:hypothetical protein